MPDREEGIKPQPADISSEPFPSEQRTEPASRIHHTPSWEDNPYRLRGLGWEGSFADTGWGSIIALAILVSPVALAIGLLGGLLLRGPRARKKAWVMAVAAVPGTAVWGLVLALKH
jgi:hypothetical protein